MENKLTCRKGKMIRGLYDMIGYIAQYKRLIYMDIVELGSYTGDASLIFSYNFNNVFAVDLWKNYFQMPAVDFKKVENEFDINIVCTNNIIKLKMDTIKASKKYKEEYQYCDVVYIDALHTYEAVKADIAAWAPLIRKGGFLAGHDYCSKWPGVIQAVNEFKKPDCVFADTSWIIRV